MTAALYPSTQLTAGIGKETTYGTPVSPTYYEVFKTLAPVDDMTPIPDLGWRGPPGDSFGHVPGPTQGAVSLGGDVYADTIGFPLAGILGDAAASGSGPVTWTMAVQNGSAEPPSYTVTTTDGVNTRRWPGVKFSSLTLTSSVDGTLTYTTTCTSLISVITTAPSPSFTTVQVIPGWRLAALIGGSAPSGPVISSTVTLSRSVTPKRNTDGTQAPYLMHSGLCTVAGELDLILLTDTYRALYVAGTSTSINLNWQQGAGATLTQTQLHCSDVILKGVAPQYPAGKFQQVKITWSADYNTTDVGASGGWSPVVATLKNAVASGTYA